MSFSFPSLCDDALAGTGNHTFAAVKCTENYDNLKQALEPVLADMNELIEAQEIEVEGKIIKLEIILGGDMKFLLVVLGMNAAHSNYACLWCNIHKKNRLATLCKHKQRLSLLITLGGMYQCPTMNILVITCTHWKR